MFEDGSSCGGSGSGSYDSDGCIGNGDDKYNDNDNSAFGESGCSNRSYDSGGGCSGNGCYNGIVKNNAGSSSCITCGSVILMVVMVLPP